MTAAGASQEGTAHGQLAVRCVTGIMMAVIGLTFLFTFGNVLTLGLRLGVPAYVAPLVAPAVDLSVLGLLLGIRHLALNGASREQMRPARRLLILASFMTLALNVAEPLLVGEYGRAAFDAVGPTVGTAPPEHPDRPTDSPAPPGLAHSSSMAPDSTERE